MTEEKEKKEGEGEQKFAVAANVIASIVDGVVMLDKNLVMTHWNPALEKLTGYKAEETIGRKIDDFFGKMFSPEEEKKILEARRIAAETGIFLPTELTFRTKEGKLGTATFSETWIKSPAGEKLGLIVVIRDLTELKKLQEEAAKTKEATILEAMIDGVAVVDMNGNIVQSNTAHAKMFGFKTPEEMKGINLSELIAERDVQRTMNDVKKCFETGIAVNYECTSKDKAGKEFPTLVNASVLKDEKGKIVGSIGIVRDITERKQAEGKFQDIIDKNPMSIQIIDKEGFTLSVNPAHTKLFGAVPPPNFSFFNDPQLKQLGFGELIERIKNGEVVNFPDTPYNAHDSVSYLPDVPVWVHVVAFPINDSNGKPERFVFMHENITERKRVEDNLIKLNNCFMEFGTDVNRNISIIVQTAGDILGGVCALYNKLEGDMICTLSKWQAPSDMLIKDKAKGHICFDAISANKETLIVRKLDKTSYAKSDPNVKKYNLKTYIGCVIKVKSKPVGSLCVVYQKDKDFMQNEIKMLLILARALETEEERRRMEEELVHSEKMAGLGQLSSGVAHEFNNLLNIIGGSAEYAQGVKDKDEVKKSLDVVVKSVNRGAQVVRNLLAFSRKTEPKKESADLSEALEEVIGLVERDLENSSIKIEKNYLDTSKTIIDVGQIQQVFLNLILNARNAMPKGGELSIKLSKENNFIKIQFHNGGKIISKEDLPRLFTPFFTTSARQKGGMPGTGMGLSVSYGIIQSHNGEIKVESGIGKGTTFTILLPVTKNKDTAVVLPKRVAKAVKTIRRRLRHAEILIVDDEVEIGRLFKKALDKKGYSVTVAGNGRDALNLCRKKSFDLIYLDIVMPGMDGNTVFKKIKEISQKIKVVLLTGKPIEDKVAEICLIEGAAGFLRKPIMLRELVSYTHNIVTK